MDLLDLDGEAHEDLFDRSHSDYDIELETEELINEVFNKKYQPTFDPAHTRERELRYQQTKKALNRARPNPHPHPKHTRTHTVYRDYSQEDLSPSFNQFLMRAQERLDRREGWLEEERLKKQQSEVHRLKEVPDILRGSREKLQPIYERCIDVQKERERKLEQQRIVKSRQEAAKLQQLPFRPTTNRPGRTRDFAQYLADK